MPSVTVTFTPNNPGQQINCNPDTVHVPYGNGQTVTWNLNGPQGAAFAATDGIAFKGASPGTLTRNSDTQYTLTDDNGNTSGQEVDYAYGVTIRYNNTNYVLDPEVANDSGGGGGRVRYKTA